MGLRAPECVGDATQDRRFQEMDAETDVVEPSLPMMVHGWNCSDPSVRPADPAILRGWHVPSSSTSPRLQDYVGTSGRSVQGSGQLAERLVPVLLHQEAELNSATRPPASSRVFTARVVLQALRYLTPMRGRKVSPPMRR